MMGTSHKFVATLASAALLVLSTGCSTQNGASSSSDDGLRIVASTGYLGDAVANVAPGAEVDVLVAPGGDPHTQALTTSDAKNIEEADLVVWTSHDMEHQMMETFDALGDKQLAAGEAIPENLLLPWEEDGKVEGHDPHVWNSPENWTYVVNAIAEKLATVDADNAATYKDNAKTYNDKITAMADTARTKLQTIPEANRVLITGHDAFNYLGESFDIEIHATDFVSSEAQISAAEIDELADLITAKKVPVIFQDNLANPEAIEHLKAAVNAKGWQVTISDKELFADSLGESAPTDTYLGVFEYNVDTIVEALGA